MTLRIPGRAIGLVLVLGSAAGCGGQEMFLPELGSNERLIDTTAFAQIARDDESVDDVVVVGDRAWLFYFTHPGRAGTIKPEDKPASETRRSSIQVVELVEKDGQLSCDRDAPTFVALVPPAGP